MVPTCPMAEHPKYLYQDDYREQVSRGHSEDLTTALILIAKGIKIAQVIAENVIPKVGVVTGMLEKLDKMQGIQRTKMSVE